MPIYLLNEDPEAFPDPERARQYLESRFQIADISIYWESTDVFIRGLYERL